MTSLTRSPLLPEVPTLDERGVKGYEVNTWFGWVGPAGLPADITNRLNNEIAKILARTDVRDNLAQQGFDVAPAAPPAAFAKVIADDMAKWIPIVRRCGAKVD